MRTKHRIAQFVRELLCLAFCHHHKRKKPKARIRVRLRIGGITVQFIGGFTMQSKDTEGKRVDFTVQFTDAVGNPAKVDGVPTIESDRPDIVAIENVAADGLSATAVFQGPLGAANITVTGDADLGEGIVAVTIAGVLERTASDATGGTIAFGTPHD